MQEVGLALLRTGPTPDAQAGRARQVVPHGPGKLEGADVELGIKRLMLGPSGEQAGKKPCPG